MVIPSGVGVGALVELKQYSCRPKTDRSSNEKPGARPGLIRKYARIEGNGLS
jgi:hypothetical protein